MSVRFSLDTLLLFCYTKTNQTRKVKEMKKNQINIRDPFVLYEGGKYYMYGTRAKNFGLCVGGVDVYLSEDMENWSDPIECFNSEEFGLNRDANWSPEVHNYKGKYYMFITLTQGNGLRGTYSLCADSPFGPFKPNSNGAVTPHEWECLDGTLYIEDGVPYLVFCHEHTQIIDGTVCYARLSESLDSLVGEVVTMFSASSVDRVCAIEGGHYVTDGPFMYRSKTDELFMIWSSFIAGRYAELAVKFKDKKLGLEFEHIAPLIDDNGGHGMIFSDDNGLYFTYHVPNTNTLERPEFYPIEDLGDSLRLKK